jgi:hypothetical protein
MRQGISLVTLVALACWASGAAAYTIDIDGDPSDWLLEPPHGDNQAHIARDSELRGEFVWVDREGDERTDFSTPDRRVDITELRITADEDNLYVLIRMNDIDQVTGDGAPQIQIAIDLDGRRGSGNTAFLRDAFTAVSSEAAWEYLVVTRFGSGGRPFLYDTHETDVSGGRCFSRITSGGAIELRIPWDLLVDGAPEAPIRFTVISLRSNTTDDAWWTAGRERSNALDVVTNYFDPSNMGNTWTELGDTIADYYFEVWFHLDPDLDPSPPLMINELLTDTPDGVEEPQGEWIEVINMTGLDDLSLAGTLIGGRQWAFKLGDEEEVSASEGTMAFPGGATIGRDEVILIANQAATYTAEYEGHPAPDFELTASDPRVTDMLIDRRWSRGSTLNLANTGDEVLLIDPFDTIIDVVSWGTETYPGVTAHPRIGAGHSIERSQPGEDSDDCPVDFSDHTPELITPGLVWGLGELGEPCRAAPDCSSSFCVAEVCCDRACDGVCDGSCVSGRCAFRPESEVCRPAAGVCDARETCPGDASDCPGDALMPSSEVCRPAAGDCDLAESCTGRGPDCPVDAFMPEDEVCRPTEGDCDVAESCTGRAASCPDDGFSPASEVCRPAAGDCDLIESCTGRGPNCPEDAFTPADEVCRPAAGVCDVAESCSGESVDCSDDAFLPDDELCRPSEGDCDVAESCPGDAPSCPDNALLDESVVCRPAAGDCDLAESCSGDTPACPANGLRPAGAECRPSGDQCDAAESCSGDAPSCPVDDPSTLDDETCNDGLEWTLDDTCEAGECLGREQGSCDASVLIDELPYSYYTTLEGRPDHLTLSGESCRGVADLDDGDVVFELDAVSGQTFTIEVETTEGIDAALAVVAECSDDEPCLAAANRTTASGREELIFTAETEDTYFVVIEAVGFGGAVILNVTEGIVTDGDADVDADSDSDMDADSDSDLDPNEGTAPGGCDCRVSAASRGGLTSLMAPLIALVLG